MRPLGLLVGGCVLVGVVLAPGPAGASTAELVQQIDGLVRTFPGGSGIWIGDPLSPSPLYTRNADTEVIAASLYKLGILAETERRVDAGELHYNDTVVIQDEDITEDGSFEDAGTELTLDEALEAMITISDNGTALALWHILGGANIDQTLAKAGMPDFHIALDDSEDHTATPRALGTFLTLLARHQLVSPAASDRMLARLGRQKINNRLPAQLPENVLVAHKTGNLAGLVHDAGIIYTKSGPRVVVTMTWDAPVDDADAFISSIGAIVYSAILEPPANARFQVPRSAVIAETGGVARLGVPITNTGTRPWAAAGVGSVGLIWEVRTSANQLVASSPRPQTLPALLPNQTETVQVSINAPQPPADYRVTIGLTDASGNALAGAGAATAAFTLRVHAPYLVAAQVQMPPVLHIDEASLLIAQWSALAAAGSTSHAVTLSWRALDPRNNRTVQQGSSALGTIQPTASGTFFVPFVAPSLLGTYRMSYELRENSLAVSETAVATVTIYGPRTYGGDDERPVPEGLRYSPPAPTPTPRFEFPQIRLPKPSLPNLPLPKGKTPTPSARP